MQKLLFVNIFDRHYNIYVYNEILIAMNFNPLKQRNCMVVFILFKYKLKLYKLLVIIFNNIIS